MVQDRLADRDALTPEERMAAGLIRTPEQVLARARNEFKRRWPDGFSRLLPGLNASTEQLQVRLTHRPIPMSAADQPFRIVVSHNQGKGGAPFLAFGVLDRAAVDVWELRGLKPGWAPTLEQPLRGEPIRRGLKLAFDDDEVEALLVEHLEGVLRTV